jgi:hypothetical protein
MIKFYILAMLIGSPAGKSREEIPFSLSMQPAGYANNPIIMEKPLMPWQCVGMDAIEAAQQWAAEHPNYVVVGTRCKHPRENEKAA